jgi:flagellar biosynthesis protein FliP
VKLQGGAVAAAAILIAIILFSQFGSAAAAGEMPILPTVENGSLVPARDREQVATVLLVVAMLTVLTLAPSILVMTTCFTRVVIVFGFLRRALATQSLPPTPVIMGLSLFLTLFIMMPTWEKSWDQGVGPYLRGELVDGATAA